MTNKNDTIAAIASPQGLGGVGVIRISGPDSLLVVQKIFSRKPNAAPNAFNAPPAPLNLVLRKLTHGYIINPAKGQILDEVMAVYMQAPATYTGEDTVEIYTHGGLAVLNAVLGLILSSGARMATGGEFTKRAFLNGKMDLTAAEAVADVINAETEKAMLSAGRNLRGALSAQLNVARETLLHAIMLLEASIDFPEDVAEGAVNLPEIKQKIHTEVCEALADIHKNYQYGCYLKQGLRLAVAGRPNVGKSSLMNRLLRQNRVLVSEEAGTTRDVVTERWNIGGFKVELADTAGIHETSHNLEKLGIAKSFETIKNCDCVLFMFEAQKGLLPEDKAILQQIPPGKIIGVANKTDLGFNLSAEDAAAFPGEIVAVSLKTGEGTPELENAVIAAVTQTSQNFDDMLVPNLRQTLLLAEILKCLAAFDDEAGQNLPAEYLCTHLEEGLKHLNDILGLKLDTDILDSIFANFCIGK